MTYSPKTASATTKRAPSHLLTTLVMTLLFLCQCGTAPSSQNQTLQKNTLTEKWVARFDGAGPGEKGVDIAVDLALNSKDEIIVTGSSLQKGQGFDFITLKYNPNGSLLWSARYNGPSGMEDKPAALCVNENGNAFVAGKSFQKDAKQDFIIIQYDSKGNQRWVDRYNGPGYRDDGATAVEALPDGGAVATGFSTGAETKTDIITIRYDAEGKRLWQARFDSDLHSIDMATDVAADDAGNIYITGYSTGRGTFFDYLTLKYDPAGKLLWSMRYNSEDKESYSFDTACCIAVDKKGNITVTGESRGTNTWTAGCTPRSNTDIATVRYDSNGTSLWSKRFRGPVKREDAATSLAIDKASGVYIAGYIHTTKSKNKAIILHYDSSGELLKKYPGPYGRYKAMDWKGGYLAVSGYCSEAGGETLLTVNLLDADLNSLGSSSYRHPGGRYDAGVAVKLDNQGRIVAAGTSHGGDTGRDIVVIQYEAKPGISAVKE